MPIYEYHCNDCQAHFEHLNLTSNQSEPIICPSCESKETEKMEINQFSSLGSDCGSGCGGCGGSCG